MTKNGQGRYLLSEKCAFFCEIPQFGKHPFTRLRISKKCVIMRTWINY